MKLQKLQKIEKLVKLLKLVKLQKKVKLLKLIKLLKLVNLVKLVKLVDLTKLGIGIVKIFKPTCSREAVGPMAIWSIPLLRWTSVDLWTGILVVAGSNKSFICLIFF